jgi:hypothetical protein
MCLPTSTHNRHHTGVCSTVQGLAEDADINSEDPEVVRRGQELLQAALASSAAIGASHMVGVIFSALKKYPGPCTPAARRNVVQSLQVHPYVPLHMLTLTCSSAPPLRLHALTRLCSASAPVPAHSRVA